MSDEYFRHISIRDPLYGFIDLSKIETQIIDTAVFRRLHNIKQLSHAYLVYPTAIHTRFEHSLGVLYLADLVAKQLDFEKDEREIIRLSALLHDLGHGPFSHLFEEVLSEVNGKKIVHEDISIMLIKENREISPILGEKTKKIIQLLEHKKVDDWDEAKSTLAADIVSSPLDVDKMDYLRRDSYHIGVAYGQFDLPRIIHTLTSTDDLKEKHLCVKDKGKDAIENYRLGRYLMHAQVYQHHTRLVADQMFLRALDLAVNEENIIDKEKLKIDPTLTASNKNFLDFYTQHDDQSIYDLIINTKPTSKAAGILKNLQQRKLLKRVFDFLPANEITNALTRDRIMRMKKLDLMNMSNEIAEKLGLEKHNVIAYLSEIPVNLYEGEILIMWKNIPRKLDEFSPIKTSESTIIKFYIYSLNDPAVKKCIQEYAEKNFGIVLNSS